MRWLCTGENQLTGSIPNSFSDSSYLQELQLSRNRLSGSIPSSIVNANGLYQLDLSFNNLSGTIPEYLGDLPGLQTVILRDNALSGDKMARCDQSDSGRPWWHQQDQAIVHVTSTCIRAGNGQMTMQMPFSRCIVGKPVISMIGDRLTVTADHFITFCCQSRLAWPTASVSPSSL